MQPLDILKITVLAFSCGVSGVEARELRAPQALGLATSFEQAYQDEAPSSESEDEDELDWGAPPIIGDYSPDTAVIWDGNSSASTWLSWVLAFLWITMVASLPLIIIKLEGKGIERAQMSLFIVMWTTFFGGIWMFTSFVLFQSVHFNRIRSLTVIEAVYFMSQILTTVGYGDITPAKPMGQVIVGVYCLFSFFVIATVLTSCSDLIVLTITNYSEQLEEAAHKAAMKAAKNAKEAGQKAHAAAKKAHAAAKEKAHAAAHAGKAAVQKAHKTAQAHADKWGNKPADAGDAGVSLGATDSAVASNESVGLSPVAGEMLSSSPKPSPRSLGESDTEQERIELQEELSNIHVFNDGRPPLEHQYMVRSVCIYAFMVFLGVVFFTLYPGEGKTLFQAIYMSVITLSTVGFGAFTPVTEVGLVFGAFWMIFGSMALVSVVGSFTQLHEQCMIRERWDPGTIHQERHAFVLDLPNEATMLEVFQQYIIAKQLMTDDQIDAFGEFCKRLGDESGVMTKKSLEVEWGLDADKDATKM